MVRSVVRRYQRAAGHQVYSIEHKYLNDGNSSGNTTVIIGDREVFVVDSCYRPSSALEDIAQIRPRGTNSTKWGGLASPGITRYFYVKSVTFTPGKSVDDDNPSWYSETDH